MNKKIMVIIVLVILFFGVVTIYKFKSNFREKKEHYFVISEIKNSKKDDETDINDKELYNDKIIQSPLYEIEYNFFNNDESIVGKVYIGEDKNLYITNINKNITHKVSNVKFKTMYAKEYEYLNGIYMHLISEDNKVYQLNLESNDIRETNIFDYRYGEKFINFVDIEYKYDMYLPGNSIFALTETGKIYNINAALRYDERVVSLYNSIYVFNDKTMTNVYGRLIEDKDGKRYKIKYIFDVSEKSGFIKDKNTIIIISENNQFICFDEDMAYVYEFDKKVKDIKFDQYYPYIDGNLEIIFEDDYKMNFTAKCNEYYCINKFAE